MLNRHCARCWPTTPPVAIDIVTLYPLPPEIIVLIFTHFLAQTLSSRKPHFIEFILLSKEIYAQYAWRLYERVVLDDRNCELFFGGLWSMDDALGYPLGGGRGMDGRREGAWVDGLMGKSYVPVKSPPNSPLERPSFEYDSTAAFHLPPSLRKVLLIRQCRQVSFETYGAFRTFLRVAEGVRKAVQAIPVAPSPDQCVFLPGQRVNGPLFSSVSHVSFGEQFMPLLGTVYDHDKPALENCNFGPRLKNVCMRHDHAFYAEDIDGSGQFPTKYVARQYSNADAVSRLLEGHLNFHRGVEGKGTSLAYHNARRAYFRKGSADTVVYDMSRMDEAYGWEEQLNDTMAYIRRCMDRLRLSSDLNIGMLASDKYPMIRFTGISLPPGFNLPSFYMGDYYPGQHPQRFEALFRSWFESTVAFVEKVGCMCCGENDVVAQTPEWIQGKRKMIV
ncbi:hypothetical protein L202_06199 [Cryptococcus amylolentus CBS 6039]|uniref:Uncharacterized protein n=1 Tax=Cryptococcus amylolentus CBS 6039 TaxID=1295533 RepID=A0A1E3HLF0_9TREE|nr:hypothetical protein L202_06199 [Cryptococcus amylolentus CBS 6039]ODN76271.1 hypothetical protein L202_06199 [Cryptococcus amylolentus CBS 6039]